MKTLPLFPPTIAVALLSVALAGCTKDRIVEGDCQPVFGSDVCTWGTMNGDNLTEFGATVPIAAAENAPADAEMVWPPVAEARIPMPAEVKAQTGIDHLSVDWEVHGHPPAAFFTPHFDLHFNLVDAATVDNIDCADTDKPTVVPAGYALPDIEAPGLGTLVGLCVPDMGMHAMSETEMASTEIFEASMVLGYYATGFIFLEPMVSQAKLLSKESFSLSVPTVAVAGKKWPTSFKAEYDEATQSYRFVFTLPAV